MGFIIEIFKFIIYSLIIVYVSKYILVKLLRKLAEILDLSPKAIGNIAGIATSMPEFLTVFFSSLQGLFGTSMYNIISSNVINLIQYIWSIQVNKNGKVIKRNTVLKIELFIVGVTIIIPIAMAILKMEANLTIVPIFILTFIMLYYVRENAYKVYKMNYINKEDEKKIKEEKRWINKDKKSTIITSIQLLGTSIILFIIGNLLGNTLDVLSNSFNIPQAIIGIILGFVTSIPELITFIEAQKHHKSSDNDEQGVIEATSNLLSSNMLNLFVIESIGIVIYMLIMSY